MDVPDSLGSAIERELATVSTPGCSVAIVDEPGLRWAYGFGFADLRSSRRATPGTVYRLSSGTKPFTAAAVLQLAERGLLSLEDPGECYVPEAQAARGVTLRHLLSHFSESVP